MNAIGIVAEYNPFHTGHGYQIAQSRTLLNENRPVVAVMSGNWVQQADCAVADKWTRARLALLGGADLVLELPTVWATASAEAFARGAVEIMERSGIVGCISFGSEGGAVEPLLEAARWLDTPDYHREVARLAGEGLPFAVCRQRAVELLAGPEVGAVLASPNNNLGVEYLKALRALDSAITPMTVQRMGAAHNSISEGDRPPFLSATQIRRDLRRGCFDTIGDYLLPGARELLSPCPIPDLNRVERAILLRLRQMSAADWASLPDSGQSEGLPQRLEKAGHSCRSLEEFYNLARTRRYTHARLRRLVLWAYLGLTAADRPAHPLYSRVLGFNDRGRELLKEMKKTSTLPIITKAAHARKLDGEARRLFELEARCTDLYDLCLEDIPAPGREWSTDPVRL